MSGLAALSAYACSTMAWKQSSTSSTQRPIGPREARIAMLLGMVSELQLSQVERDEAHIQILVLDLSDRWLENVQRPASKRNSQRSWLGYEDSLRYRTVRRLQSTVIAFPSIKTLTPIPRALPSKASRAASPPEDPPGT